MFLKLQRLTYISSAAIIFIGNGYGCGTSYASYNSTNTETPRYFSQAKNGYSPYEYSQNHVTSSIDK